MKRMFAAAALAAATLSAVTASHAAEIRVLAGTATSAILNELGPRFERVSGHKVTIRYAVGALLAEQIDAGEFDVAILPTDLLSEPVKQRVFAPGNPAEVARVGIGVAVRAGAPKPDVISPDAFRQSLLDAKSIAFVPTGSSGVHTTNVFKRLGIHDAIGGKLKPQKTAEDVVSAVSRGEAELALFVANVLTSAKGLAYVGPFPAQLQQHVVFGAYLGAKVKDAEAARTLVTHLADPAGAEVIASKGMEPPRP